MLSECIRMYEDREDVTLTTYVLDDSKEMLDGKKRPAVVICPGGAYLSCSDRESEPVAMKFAAMGYHAFVLRYSTYSEGKNEFPDMSVPLRPKSRCQYPNPMNEVGMAFDLICAHADEWHVDEDRIAVCGFSAGAHNAAMYAANWQDIPGARRPAAAVLGYGLSDYVYKQECTKRDIQGNRMAMEMLRASNIAYMGVEEPDVEILDKVSPARHITEHMPPAFLWATAEDGMVPVQQTIIMARALADAHIPFEVHIFEKGPHGLSVATQAGAGAWSETDKDAEKWMALCEAWLMKRFRLDLPELNAFQTAVKEGKI